MEEGPAAQGAKSARSAGIIHLPSRHLPQGHRDLDFQGRIHLLTAPTQLAGAAVGGAFEQQPLKPRRHPGRRRSRGVTAEREIVKRLTGVAAKNTRVMDVRG